jgi:hypothetical protein
MAYKKPGSLKWPNVGANWVPEFQISSIPWATSSLIFPDEVHSYSFYRVTRFINVVNNSANPLRVSYTKNGVNDAVSNFTIVPAGEQLNEELKLIELHIQGSGSGNTEYSVLAGITGCDPRQYVVLTGSVGFEAVG